MQGAHTDIQAYAYVGGWSWRRRCQSKAFLEWMEEENSGHGNA